MKNNVLNRLFFSVLLCVFLSYCSESAKLNKPRVLLPLYSQYPNNFTLQVDDGGCYKWTTKTPTIVRLSVIDSVPSKSCSSKAVVTAVTNEDARHTAIIFVEDVNSGEILRCDVIVDSIASLSIVTTTREIFIEEAPEVFEVQAYDAFGNQFTTLDGFVFEWSVTAVTRKGISVPSLTHKVIKLMKFEESHYKVPSSSLAEIESAGLHGNKVLLFGMSTGQAQVGVSLLQPQYEGVQPAPPVILSVIANLVLDPQDSLLLPNTKVHYRLELVRQGRLEQLPLPSEQYQLEVENGAVARLVEGSTVEALRVGRTRVLLRDNNALDPDEEGRTIHASLRVGDPAALELQVLPTLSWYAVVGRDYQLHVRVLDANKHAFHIGDDVRIDIEASEAHLMPLERLTSDLRGRAVAVGVVPVTARLRNTKLSAKGTLLINELVKVIPQHTYLPWIKNSLNYEVKLFANVATADGSPPSFKWQSKNPLFASVDQEGLVTTKMDSVKRGSTSNISVSLAKDPLNVAFASIYFLPPCKLSIIGGGLQAEVGTILNIPLTLFICNQKHEELLASNCQHLKFDVSADSELTYNSSVNGKPHEKACTTIPVYSNIPKTLTKVTVRLTFVADDGNTVQLEATTIVSFYKPLRVVYPESAETVLAPGASRNIMFEGGPRTLPGQKEIIHYLNWPAARKVAQAWELDHSSGSIVVVRVECIKIGNTVLQLAIATHSDPHAIITQATVNVYCALPDKLTLTPSLPEPDFQHCSTSPGSYVTLADTEFEIVASIFDRKGRKFDNISSIAMSWSSDPKEVAQKLPRDMLEDAIREETYGLMMPGRLYHVLKPARGVISLTIKASLRVEGMEVSGEAKVNMVEQLQLNPKTASVYNHSSKVARIKVLKGSTSYLISVLEGENVADVQLIKARRTIEVVPRQPGKIRIAVVDACLPKEMRETVVAEVEVLGVDSVRVEVASQVQQGRSVEATLLLLGTDGQALSPPSALPIIPRADSTILEVKQLPDPLKFSVFGVSLGDSELKFVVDDAESQPASVHVFPPIKLWPRDLTLVPGAILQATTQGGPKIPDATLLFSSATHEKPSALHASESGVLQALNIGTSTLTVRAMAPDESVYSEDSAPVRVVALTGIEVWVPTRKLEQGTCMPAYVMGKSDTAAETISPFVMATLSLKYIWSEKGGSLLVHSQESVVRVEALNVGVTELLAEVVLADGTRLAHGVMVEVIPAQRLTLPARAPAASPLLIAPHTKVQLAVTNGQFLQNCGGEGIITVSESGLVTSLGPLGRATIIIPDHKTNQELEVVIKVVPIHYIMAEASAPLSTGVFPRGMKAPISVTYHDSIGREILVPGTEQSIKWLSSRPQTLSLRQNRLQLGEPGRAVLDVWDQTHHAFLTVHVHQVISPLILAVGDHVCFDLGQAGEWNVQPKTIMRVNAKSGWAVALQSGEVNVQFNTDEGSTTWAEVQIRPASKLQLMPSEQPFAINTNQPLIISFVVKPSGEQARRTNLLENGCAPPTSDYVPHLPVECKASWEDSAWDDSLRVTSGFNFKTGLYFCNVTTRLREAKAKMAVSACLLGSDVCLDKISVPFYRAVRIENKEVFVNHLGGQFIISGPPLALSKISIEVSPGLEVGIAKEASPGSVVFPLTLAPVFWTLPNARKYGSLLVNVDSPLTGQKFILPVVVEDSLQAPVCPRPLKSSSWWQYIQEHRGEAIGIVSAFVIVAASIQIYWVSRSFSAPRYTVEDDARLRQQNLAGGNSPFAPRNSSFLSGNGSLNMSNLSGSSSPGGLPYAGTHRVYGNQHDQSWHGGSPRLS